MPIHFGAEIRRMDNEEFKARITAMTTEGQAEFQPHLERLLAHADLRAIQWINIARPVVRFKTIWNGKKGKWQKGI